MPKKSTRITESESFDASPAGLATHLYEWLQKNATNESIPPEKVIKELAEILFFASMQTEEAELVKVRVAYYDPNNAKRKATSLYTYNYIPFEKPIQLEIKTLVKLSKSADPWSSSIAVCNDHDGKLWILGLIDQAVHAEAFLSREFTAQPAQAGLFQMSIIGIGSLSIVRKYELIATLKQNSLVTSFIDVLRVGPVSALIKEKASGFLEEVAEYVDKNYTGFTPDDYTTVVVNTWRDSISRLLIHIRNYQHGGAILLTSTVNGIDIRYPVIYKRLNQAMMHLVECTLEEKVTRAIVVAGKGKMLERKKTTELLAAERQKRAAENELKGAIRFVAAHSRVDGLILLDDHLIERGYGAMVGDIQVKGQLLQANDATALITKERSPKDFGSRHRSMMAFCEAYPGSLGFVVSQDGDIRAFTKHNNKLIMWENIKTHKYLTNNKLKAVPMKKTVKRVLRKNDNL